MNYIVLAFLLQFLSCVFSDYFFYDGDISVGYKDQFCPVSGYQDAYEYDDLIRPITPSIIQQNGTSYELIDKYYYKPTKQAFTYAGTYLDSTDGNCRVCRYHKGTNQLDTCEQSINFGMRSCYTPMYGYCYSGIPSRKMSCVQNTLMNPTNFFGEFFYPDQKFILRLNFLELSFSWYYFVHNILQKTSADDNYNLGFSEFETWESLAQGLSSRNVLRDLNRELYSDMNFDHDGAQVLHVNKFRNRLR